MAESATTPEFSAALRRFMESRVERDSAKLAAETAEKAYREAEADIWELLSESELEGSIPVNLGEPFGVVRFQPRETFYARVIDKEAALEGFEQRAMIDEISAPKIVMERLNSIVREKIEAGEPMPPGVDYTARRYVTVTRQKS